MLYIPIELPDTVAQDVKTNTNDNKILLILASTILFIFLITPLRIFIVVANTILI